MSGEAQPCGNGFSRIHQAPRLTVLIETTVFAEGQKLHALIGCAIGVSYQSRGAEMIDVIMPDAVDGLSGQQLAASIDIILLPRPVADRVAPDNFVFAQYLVG